MARNFNVVSMTFDGQVMGSPMQWRAKIEGQTIEDSAGIDPHVSTNDLVARRVPCQCMYKDLDNSLTMMTTKHGVVGTLVLITHQEGTTTLKTITITNVRCIDVDTGAEHKGYSIHVATFVGVSTDGNTNPVS